MTTETFEAELVRWRRRWSRSQYTKTTLDEYVRQVRAYRSWCSEHGVESASLRSADEYIGVLEVDRGQTARSAARAIRAYGRFLVDDQLTPPTPGARAGEDAGPFNRLQLPVEPAPLNAPTASDDDVAKLLATCKTVTPRNGRGWVQWDHMRDAAIILTMVHTGMRRGEIAAMTLDTVDLVNETVWLPVTKAKEPRRIALHPDAAGAILRYLRASEKDRPQGERALWLSIVNRPMAAMTPNGIGQMMARRGKTAGVDVRAHAFRRRHAGRWMAAGGSEVGLMQNNGWKSTAMIQRYSKATLEANTIEEARRLFG